MALQLAIFNNKCPKAIENTLIQKLYFQEKWKIKMQLLILLMPFNSQEKKFILLNINNNIKTCLKNFIICRR